MKIAHIITRLIVGGAQENTIFTVEGLARKGHQVVLFSGPTTGPEGSLEERVTVQSKVSLIRVKHLVRNVNPVADLLALRKLAFLLGRGRYEIVHTHSAKAGILGRLAAAMAVPGAVVIHTVHGPSFYPYQPRLLRWLYTLAEKIAGYFTDYFICVGEVMKETYLKAGIGRPSRYRVIYSGFDLLPYQKDRGRRLALRQRLGIRENERVIGMIGRLFPLKGQEYLLKAFAEVVQIFPETKLLLVGEGILRRKLQTLAAAHKIRDRVIFAGLVPPEEIPEYVAAMDIVAHTSLREGLPRAVAQGLAGGKPVVAFDVDGARELVKDGQTGYLVPARDNNTLIARLLHLLKNPQAAEAMGQAGRRLIEELFPVEKMVEKIEALYREALRRKRCSSSPHDVTYTYS